MDSGSRKKVRVSKISPPVVEEWVKYFERVCKSRKVEWKQYVGTDNLYRTAGLLALFSDREQAIPVFRGLVEILVHQERRMGWRVALDVIPPNMLALTRIGRAAMAASSLEPLIKAKFDPKTFIQAVLLIEDPLMYVRMFREQNPPHTVRRAFHPNTVEWMAKRYRGLLSPIASVEHRDSIISDVPVIT